MEPLSLEDLDEIDLLLTELKISQGKGNLIICTVASPAYRENVIEVIKERFPARIMAVENGDRLISDLRSIRPLEKDSEGFFLRCLAKIFWTLETTSASFFTEGFQV